MFDSREAGDHGRDSGEVRVVRLTVTAFEDDTSEAVSQARREARHGDPSWQEWLERFDSGKAAILRLRTEARFELRGEDKRVEVVNDGVWVDCDIHLPKVEEQIRQIAYKDISALRDRIRGHGAELAAAELEDMFFHVALSGELLSLLRTRAEETV